MYIYIQTYIYTDIHPYIHTDREPGRQADRHTYIYIVYISTLVDIPTLVELPQQIGQGAPGAAWLRCCGGHLPAGSKR